MRRELTALAPVLSATAAETEQLLAAIAHEKEIVRAPACGEWVTGFLVCSCAPIACTTAPPLAG